MNRPNEDDWGPPVSLEAFRKSAQTCSPAFGGLRARLRPVLWMLVAFTFSGCSVKRFTVNRVGDALAGSSSAFAEEDDPELARAAVPFGLKTLEGLLAESPQHRGLLLAACSGFTQYAYAFVQQDADFMEAEDLGRATEIRARAKQLYLRAREFGLRGLELDCPDFRARFQADPEGTLALMTRSQVPLLYYTAASWAGAFSLDVADSTLSVDQTKIEKMMRRALTLDEAWQHGAIHEFLGSWEAGHAGAGGSLPKAHEHFERARQLSGGQRASVFVSQAEALAVGAQDRKTFEACLKEALALDVSKAPSQRLANRIAQKRARWLVSKVDDLFLDAPDKEGKQP